LDSITAFSFPFSISVNLIIVAAQLYLKHSIMHFLLLLKTSTPRDFKDSSFYRFGFSNCFNRYALQSSARILLAHCSFVFILKVSKVLGG
jgi:hypothetical protein